MNERKRRYQIKSRLNPQIRRSDKRYSYYDYGTSLSAIYVSSIENRYAESSLSFVFATSNQAMKPAFVHEYRISILAKHVN